MCSSEFGRKYAVLLAASSRLYEHATRGYNNVFYTQVDAHDMSEPARKRRAVRKGTRNCWECKRRKVRCVFATPASAACENCLHRNATCVSQAFEKETENTSTSPIIGLEARLTRVELLLQQVLDHTETTALVDFDHAHEEHVSVSENHVILSPMRF